MKKQKHGRLKPRVPQRDAERYVPMKDGQTNSSSKAVKRVLGIVEEMHRVYDDDISERSKERGDDFFDSILTKADDIAATIKDMGRTSEAQEGALERMLVAMRKWVHKKRDD